jgi:hypothetical protein
VRADIPSGIVMNGHILAGREISESRWDHLITNRRKFVAVCSQGMGETSNALCPEAMSSHLRMQFGRHFAIRGTQPPPVDTPETSIWRDINIFDEVGIPSATFGMPHKSAPDAEERFVDV